MKFLRPLTHQPLLLWFLLTLVLLLVGFAGLNSEQGSGRPGSNVSTSSNGWVEAQALLAMLPEANAALAAETFPAWASDFRAIAVKAAEDYDQNQPDTDISTKWQTVVERSATLARTDTQDRGSILAELSLLNSSVTALVRSYSATR